MHIFWIMIYTYIYIYMSVAIRRFSNDSTIQEIFIAIIDITSFIYIYVEYVYKCTYIRIYINLYQYKQMWSIGMDFPIIRFNQTSAIFQTSYMTKMRNSMKLYKIGRPICDLWQSTTSGYRSIYSSSMNINISQTHENATRFVCIMLYNRFERSWKKKNKTDVNGKI